MNKLGFYVENTTVTFLRDALRQVRPPVMLVHAQDRGLLHEIRRELSPDTFIIGRIFKELGVQEAWLDSNPAAGGRQFAEEILRYDFGFAQERGANGRLLIDAWMSLNETPAGPASFPNFQVDEQYRRRAPAYDAFQVAFHERLRQEGLAAVAFNFAAGNYIRPDHYLNWFPGTLESYTYLGFHEYGWPALKPGPGVATAAGFYRTCMDGIRQKYGNRHKVIITEAGVTMAYGHPQNPDEGWLNHHHTLAEEHYWESLRWYNEQLRQDDYVMGACLFQVGPGGRWQTFRHLGVDNESRAIMLIPRIAALRTEAPPQPGPPDLPEPPEPEPEPEPEPPVIPPPPASAAELQARAATLAHRVATARQAVEPLPGLAEALAAQVDGQATAARDLSQVAATAANLQARLRALQSVAANLPAEQRQRLQALLAELDALAPQAGQASELPAAIAALQRDLATSAASARQQAIVAATLEALLADVRMLQLELAPDLPEGGAVAPPPLQDLRGVLPVHPDKRYPQRNASAIRRIIVHHTVTSDMTAPETIARLQVERRNMPGISYHFMIDGAGQGYWTQALEVEVEQTSVAAANADGIGVGLIGDFTSAAPTPAQLHTAAQLIASLLSMLRLDTSAVIGRNELERVGSPGAQWLSGARYKATLLDQVRAWRAQA